MKNTKNGFTVIEMVIVSAFLGLLFGLFFIQKVNLDAADRDDTRKTAINAMYFALEESFYQDYGYYPEEINEQNLPVIDPALWSDPNGRLIGDPLSSYHYEPADCSNGKCKQYILRANLEKEDTYIKTSRHN